ncbi:MAG: hypothetical protein KHX36_03345, partial [Clostridiales bacterium]|nr:hypothetical protein [Clostridiales bacterium]
GEHHAGHGQKAAPVALHGVQKPQKCGFHGGNLLISRFIRQIIRQTPGKINRPSHPGRKEDCAEDPLAKKIAHINMRNVA